MFGTFAGRRPQFAGPRIAYFLIKNASSRPASDEGISVDKKVNLFLCLIKRCFRKAYAVVET
jgi:hypothetical protein